MKLKADKHTHTKTINNATKNHLNMRTVIQQAIEPLSAQQQSSKRPTILVLLYLRLFFSLKVFHFLRVCVFNSVFNSFRTFVYYLAFGSCSLSSTWNVPPWYRDFVSSVYKTATFCRMINTLKMWLWREKKSKLEEWKRPTAYYPFNVMCIDIVVAKCDESSTTKGREIADLLKNMKKNFEKKIIIIYLFAQQHRASHPILSCCLHSFYLIFLLIYFIIFFSSSC